MWDEEFPGGDTGFWHEPDFFLTDLVSGFVNKGGMQLGVTLFMKGIVLTGTLVSEREYLAAMSEMFSSQARKSMVNPSKEELKATDEVFDFTTLAEDLELSQLYKDEPAEKWDDEDEDDYDEPPSFPTIRHLHLKDPMIVQPQPAMSFGHSQVAIMRIRLTQIDGWMVGKVSVQDDFDDGFPPPPPSQIRH
jgi:hypothetical protein